MARRRTRRTAPRARAPEPLNWPLALGVTGLVGGAVYYFGKVRPAAAQAAALQTILPGPAPLPAPPQSTPNPQPTIPPPPPPSATLPPVPAGAARAAIAPATIRAIQASLNLLGGCGCRTLVVNGVWNADTEDAWRCYLRKLNASLGRAPDISTQLDVLTPANADAFLVALQTALPRIVASVAGCTTP